MSRERLAALTEGLTLPMIGAPMFLASGVDLVVAQCCAGIIGTFPSLNARPAEALDAWLTEIETRLAAFERETGRRPAPYGVNLIVNPYNERMKPDLETIARHEVPLVITSLSAPDEVVEVVHGYGGLVFHDVIKARHARRAAKAGVDGLILVGAGAGGHAGTLSPFALVEDVRAFWDGPLVLSGAIANGRSVLAAEALGCDLAYAGSVFIATEEAIAPEAHKRMVVESGSDGILYTPLFSGTHGNYLTASIEAAGVDIEEARQAGIRTMTAKDDASRPKAWRDVWSAGQAVGQTSAIEPAAQVIERMVHEYAEARAKMTGG